MKKLLIIIGIIFIILISAVIVLPMIFKDDIREAMDSTMDESLNATVYYDIDGFSLSLIKNFPDITVSMSDFGVVGQGVFSQDTLTSVKNFQVTVDLMSVITGGQIVVEEISLDEPKILILVLPDGSANYDIAKASEEVVVEEETDTADSDVSVGIEKWQINNAKVVYRDQSMNFYTSLVGLNHEGSGDFTLDVFDLQTKTTVDKASLGFEGVEYVSDKQLDLDVTLNMDLSQMKFTFKDNRIAVNQFAMQADGYLSMPNEDIVMDITFGGKDISVKSILSLIPGVYLEYLNGVNAEGEVGFDGFVRGTFNETSMPQVAANLSVENGKISYADFNIPIENLNIQSSFDYPSADLSETSFNIDNFSMLVDGEAVSSYLKFKNLENYQWDFGFEGNADLEKITKIVPLEGITLLGRINAKLKTTGQMADVEAERYDKLPTSGSMTIDNFLFKSDEYLPQGFEISRANLTFDPAEINLSEFSAKSGNSDFSLNGKVSNYLGFALSENEILSGRLDFKSSLIDLNELMPESTEEVEEDTTEMSLEVIRIPENIDFTLASSIDKIAYSNMPITNFKGQVLIKDGAIILDQNSFNMLDGTFELTGSYVTKDVEKPTYDLGFKVKDLSIASAFETFETVQSYVPIAKQVAGNFSTEFSVNGILGEDMMPIMDSLYLNGLVNVVQATLEKGTFMQKLSSVSALKAGASSQPNKSITLKDVLIKTEIKNGRMYIEPFNLNVQGQKAVLGGNNGLDGTLDYSMILEEVPTGQIGSALNSAISSLTGGEKLVADKINVNLGIGGTYEDVKVRLLGTSNASDASDASIKQKLSSQIDAQKQKLEDDLAGKKEELEAKKEEQRKKIIAQAEAKAEEIRAQGKASAEKVRKEGYEAADKLIADAGSNPIKKKLAQEAAKKLRAETDKKAEQIESEANTRADKLVAEAKEKAAKL
ncbi:AsmA family protein [Ekhidna lutea]|uniref:AsmA family protein n=1 Tax=Ekhidna lutea TaxID=447679 RepID=A0A239EUC5_EKHLU|nr:AsmA-like C-terminal region-containing protein [Ekhidna lutea]SNS48255.1 AsmA family protein [Ekhidna lutea]